MLAAATASLPGSARAADPDLDQQKAEFALNFARFTYWPPGSFPLRSGRFALCQFRGSEPLARALRALEGRIVQGYPIAFRRIDNLAQAPACMLLFSSSGGGRAPQLRASDPVLIVGDGPRFVQQGGMIGMVQDGAQLRFEVNVAAMQRSGFAMSSQALSLASRVIEPAALASVEPLSQPAFVPATSEALSTPSRPSISPEPAVPPSVRGR